MQKLILLLLLFLAPLGCTATDHADHHPTRVPDPANPIRVACVGDSITFGAAVQDRAQNCYPAQLGRMLGEGYAVTNFGVSGATMLKQGDKPYWKLNQFKAAQELKPEIVIIKLGTNDTKPHNWQHKEQYKADYLEMIKTFKALESNPAVYICYPAPVVGERWGISDKTVRGEVIPLLDEIEEAGKVRIIDLYAPLKDKPELLPDKVHPNAQGATVIAETVKQSITKN